MKSEKKNLIYQIVRTFASIICEQYPLNGRGIYVQNDYVEGDGRNFQVQIVSE